MRNFRDRDDLQDARGGAQNAASRTSPFKMVSGGQSGVDRAVLDAALAAGVDIGGWCPRGRRAEDGPLDEMYPLRETPSEDYRQRTAWNVRDSDATLVLTAGAPIGGTALTIERCRATDKPVLEVDLEIERDIRDTVAWLRSHGVRTLNVAGPRESESPGVYSKARGFLSQLLAEIANER